MRKLSLIPVRVNWTVSILSKCLRRKRKCFTSLSVKESSLTKKALDRQKMPVYLKGLLYGNTRLNKLKKYAPEAFYYWLEIELLLS